MANSSKFDWLKFLGLLGKENLPVSNGTKKILIPIAITVKKLNTSLYLGTLYINGIKVNSANLNTPQTLAGCSPRIGQRHDGSSRFSGYLDELYFFNKALSDNEIMSLFLK